MPTVKEWKCPKTEAWVRLSKVQHNLLSTHCPHVSAATHMLSTCSPHDIHMPPTYHPHAIHMLSTHCPCGVHVPPTCCPYGVHMLSVWHTHATHMLPTGWVLRLPQHLKNLDSNWAQISLIVEHIHLHPVHHGKDSLVHLFWKVSYRFLLLE